MRVYSIFLSLLMAAIFIFGCGGHNDLSGPVTPDNNNPAMESRNGSGHVLWGMVQVHVNPTGVNTADVEVVPLRGVMFNCNVQQFLSPPFSPTHLMSFEFLPDTDFPSGYVNVKVGLQHPFPSLPYYRGFDVRGILMADGSTAGEHDSDIAYGKPPVGGGPADDAYMQNPDGYTRWWNYSEFTDPMPLLSFKPGDLGNDPDPLATLNPYKYFADELGSDDDVAGLVIADRGTFSASGSANTRDYQIQFPSEAEIIFNYAIDASWYEPDPAGEPNYPIDSFPDGAQTQEAYHISVCDAGSDAYFISDTVNGGNIRLDIEVYDWQAVSNPAGVPGEVAALWLEGNPLAAPVDVLPFALAGPGSVGTSSVFHVDLTGSQLNLTSSDIFTLLGTVESADPDSYMPQIDGGDAFVYPDAPLAAYFMTEIFVTDETPQNFTLTSPNGGEEWAYDSEQEITWTGAESVTNVRLSYSKDDFVSDNNTIEPSTENDGSCMWTVPADNVDDISDTVKVRVEAVGNPLIYDDSDDYFAIVLKEVIVCTRLYGTLQGCHIYAIDPEGEDEPERLTPLGAETGRMNPKISPCGRYVLYNYGVMSFSVRVLDLLNGTEQDIQPSGYTVWNAAFSHDGTKIVASLGTSFIGPYGLWTMNYDGSDAVQITTGMWGVMEYFDPEYNYDDTKIYYMDPTSNDIWIHDIALGTDTQYTNAGSNSCPHGSPDGARIAWQTSNDVPHYNVYVSPISGWNPPDYVISFASPVTSQIRSVCFSPDGTRLVVNSGPWTGSGDSYRLSVYTVSDESINHITNYEDLRRDRFPDWGVIIPH